tara:strand:+ start:3152 stop:3652 length:501 start_codon:yes stop_codon:yes gene_type:complete
MRNMRKIGFGGGCHWCTEAVFMALKGVVEVDQGFIAPEGDIDNLSEAVIVHYNSNLIELKDLVAIHLDTHQSSQNHSMRHKYRSAVYYFKMQDEDFLKSIITELQKEFSTLIITSILTFGQFKSSKEKFINYYFNDTEKPFCKTHISPKIQLLKEKYAKHVSTKVP